MDYYSYSRVQTFINCPLKFRYHYIDQLVPNQIASAHDLNFGKAGHAALAVLYGGGTITQAQRTFVSFYPESDYPSPLPHWSPGKSFAGGLAAIRSYADYYEEEDQHWEVLSVEDIATAETEEDEQQLVRLDLVVRDRRDGLIYGVDHKWTGKYLDSKFWLGYDPHSQIRQYTDSLQRKYGEVGGFYINAISCRNRSKAYTPRTGPQKGQQLPAGDWHDFKRMLFNPNANAIAAERDSLKAWLARIETAKQTDSWGYNTDHCVRGPFVCEYHQICSVGYAYPRDADLIETYYHRQCIQFAANGEQCQLEPGHTGECDSTRAQQQDFEVSIAEDEIEDAEA